MQRTFARVSASAGALFTLVSHKYEGNRYAFSKVRTLGGLVVGDLSVMIASPKVAVVASAGRESSAPGRCAPCSDDSEFERVVRSGPPGPSSAKKRLKSSLPCYC